MARETAEPKPNKELVGLAKAAIWLGGSALVGSLALVLWNRRTLRSLREAQEEPPRLPVDDDIY